VHVPLAGHEQELLLGKIRIDDGERDAVESQIPSGVPGVLPFVGHRNNIGVVKVTPFMIAPVQSFLRRVGAGRVAFEPAIYVVVIKLLTPQKAADGLAHDLLALRRGRCQVECFEEFVGFFFSFGENLVKFAIDGFAACGSGIAQT
jgi:hypothetical protein